MGGGGPDVVNFRGPPNSLRKKGKRARSQAELGRGSWNAQGYPLVYNIAEWYRVLAVVAVKLYTIAIDNAEPGMETPLLIARSKAQSRLVNHEAARRDALAVTDPQPDNLRGLENDASTLYEKDDFEDSLVRNYCGFRKRKKPANFYSGILVVCWSWQICSI